MKIWKTFLIGLILCVIGIVLSSIIFSSESIDNDGESFLVLSIISYSILIFFISGLNSIYLSFLKDYFANKWKLISASLLPVIILGSLIFLKDSLFAILSSFFAIPILLTNIIWNWKTIK